MTAIRQTRSGTQFSQSGIGWAVSPMLKRKTSRAKPKITPPGFKGACCEKGRHARCFVVRCQCPCHEAAF